MSKSIKLFSLLFLAIIMIVIAPFLGREIISFGELSTSAQENFIFWNLRAPRIIVAFLAGGALSLSGLSFQTLFRNPLATPYTLGIASGASFGAALGISLGLDLSYGPFNIISLFSLAGAAVSVFVTYFLSQKKEGFHTSKLLLAGVALGLFFSSLILALQYFLNETSNKKLIHWLMGSLEVVGFEQVYYLGVPITLSFLILYFKRKDFNLLMVHEDFAHTRGVDVRKSQKILFLIGSVLVASVVSFCGPIGFVGLIIPHFARILLGLDSSYLIPGSFLIGGIFLVSIDLLTRVILPEGVLPIGILTSLIGGPSFIYFLRKSRF